MDDALMAAVRALLADIEAMRLRDADPGWYGPFDESDTAGPLSVDVVVQWPNLAISVDAVRALLPRPASTR